MFHPAKTAISGTMVLVVWTCLGASTPARADHLYTVTLVPDGSIEPPGDRIDVSVLLLPEARDARVEVRAYRVTREEQVRVAATGERNSEKGDFLLAELLRARGESIRPTAVENLPGVETKPAVTRFDRALVVPYSDLKLALGDHLLGYEVRLVVNDETVETYPTDLTQVKVTEGTRDAMEIVVRESVLEWNRFDRTACLWTGNKLVMKQSMVAQPEPRTVARTVTLPVPGGIRGEFRRSAAQAEDGARIQAFVPVQNRTVYFATNRVVEDPNQDEPDLRYGNDSEVALDRLRYGASKVNIPVRSRRSKGSLAVPETRYWAWIIPVGVEPRDENKHFFVTAAKDDWTVQKLREDLGPDDLLLFIHGYNNTPSDALLRAAQLHHDLEFPGKVMAFLWPSCGDTLLNIETPFDRTLPQVKIAYWADETQAGKSARFLAKLLEQLSTNAADAPPRKIHILAHSMGNRVLLRALDLLRQERKLPASAFSEVILAAADIDGASFSNAQPALQMAARRLSFYFARDDLALLASQADHVNKPVGLGPLYMDTMDTISADRLTLMFNSLGHTYVADSKPMLEDIRLLLKGLPPLERRPPLGVRVEDEEWQGRFHFTFPRQ